MVNFKDSVMRRRKPYSIIYNLIADNISARELEEVAQKIKYGRINKTFERNFPNPKNSCKGAALNFFTQIMQGGEDEYME